MAQITIDQISSYADKQREIREKANNLMADWVREHGTGNRAEMNAYAKALADRYGSAAGSYACQYYDELATIQGATVPSAEVAEVMSADEVAFAMNGAMANSELPEQAGSVVERVVKQVAMDTIMQNMMRDDAVWAWVPGGKDTCAFCIVIASRGWQDASKAQIKGDHAEHVHAHCNCEFVISFYGGLDVKGYDPDRYLEMYENASGGNSYAKLRALRNDLDSQRRPLINAQKRQLYAKTHPVRGATDTGKEIVLSSGQKIPYGTRAGFTGMTREQAIEQAKLYTGNKDIK